MFLRMWKVKEDISITSESEMISGEDFGCKSLPNATKRKQDFLFFSLPCLLVSDDDKNGRWNANQGVTLPNGTDATHNIALSPLFIGRYGYGLPYDEKDINATIGSRGMASAIWSSSVFRENSAFFLNFADFVSTPSLFWAGDNISIYSLRCLVSTNNG